MPPRLCSTSWRLVVAAVDAGQHARIRGGVDHPIAAGSASKSLRRAEVAVHERDAEPFQRCGDSLAAGAHQVVDADDASALCHVLDQALRPASIRRSRRPR